MPKSPSMSAALAAGGDVFLLLYFVSSLGEACNLGALGTRQTPPTPQTPLAPLLSYHPETQFAFLLDRLILVNLYSTPTEMAKFTSYCE